MKSASSTQSIPSGQPPSGELPQSMQSTPMQTLPQAPQAPQTGGGGVDEIMQMLKQQQPSVSQQAYASMMGGGFYGGILPHGSLGMSPIKAPNPPAQSAVQNQMSFGASPWPGAWGS